MTKTLAYLKKTTAFLLSTILFITLFGATSLAATKKVLIVTSDKSIVYVQNVGDTAQLNPTVNPSDAPDQALTYQNSDTTGKVNVSPGGIITLAQDVSSMKENDLLAVITITPTNDPDYKGIPGICYVLKGKPVTSITTTSPLPSTLEAGKELDVKSLIDVQPSNASAPFVFIASKNPEIISVKKGNLRAISPGTTTIVIESIDGAKKIEHSITVTGTAVKGLTLPEEKEISLTVGQTFNLDTTVLPTNASNKRVYYSLYDSNYDDILKSDILSITPTLPPGVTHGTPIPTDVGTNPEKIADYLFDQIANDAEMKAFMFKMIEHAEKAKLQDILDKVDYELIGDAIDNGDLEDVTGIDDLNFQNVLFNLLTPHTFTEGPLKIKAQKAGVVYLSVYSEDGEYSSEIKITVKKAAPEVKVPDVPTGDSTNTTWYFLAIGLSACAFFIGRNKKTAVKK